jgi:hypothetical protein
MTAKMTNIGWDVHLKSRVVSSGPLYQFFMFNSPAFLQYRNQSVWSNVGAMMKKIDTLPHGQAWRVVTMEVKEGDNSCVVVVYI